MQLHTRQNSCEACKKVFARRESLQKHYQKNKACRLASVAAKYSSPSSSSDVSSAESKTTTLTAACAKLACSVCGKRQFADEKACDEHASFCRAIQQITKNGASFCPQCREHFSTRSGFFKHVFTHTHPHSCNMCFSRFRSVASKYSRLLYYRPFRPPFFQPELIKFSG